MLASTRSNWGFPMIGVDNVGFFRTALILMSVCQTQN